MKSTLGGAIAAMVALVAFQAPLAAQDATDQLIAWQDEISAAYSLDWDERDSSVERLLEVARSAETSLASGEAVGSDRLDLLKIVGTAYFGAAQHHDSEWDEESDTLDREWLVKTITALEPVLAQLGGIEGPAYEFRGAAGQLFNHGRYYDLPEWREWSRMRVLGNRYMSEGVGADDDFERELLAISLYEHGWLTSDQALIDEAEAIYASFPQDDRPSAIERAHEAVTAGEAPYPPAGSLF